MFLNPSGGGGEETEFKLSHSYNTRESRKKIMDNFEKENGELKEEVTALKEYLERLNIMVEELTVLQSRPSLE